jgi:paraquat-inducible protein A
MISSTQQIRVFAESVKNLFDQLAKSCTRLISASVVTFTPAFLGFSKAGLVRAPDGHAVHEPLASRPSDPLDRPLARTLAAAIVFVVANTAPLMGLSAVGRQASTSIIGGAFEMWVQGRELTAVIVAFCVVIAPASYIAFMLTVLLAVRWPPAPPWVGELLRWAGVMQPWSMNEVMMLGVLVALVKIAELATVIPGIGMYAVGILVLLPAIMVAFDPGEVWKRVEWADGTHGPGAAR